MKKAGCSKCGRPYETRPNDLCSSATHWQSFVQASESFETALVAAAYEAAARLCVPGTLTFIYEIAKRIRALTPAHALDTLQTMLTRAQEDGRLAKQEHDKAFEKEAWEAGYEKAKEWCAQRCEWFADAIGAQDGHDLEVWSAKRCAEEIRAPGAMTKLSLPKKDPIR